MVNQMIRIPKGCVLWLDLTEDTGNVLYDHSGYGNNGRVYGAILEKRLPFIGRKFDGVDDYIKVLDSPSLDITDEITIMAWIYPITAAYAAGIVSKGTTVADAYMLYFATNEPYNRPKFYLKTSAGSKGITHPKEAVLNQWSLVAATYDGSKMKVYLNESYYEESWSGTINTNDAFLKIGILYKYKYYFNGIIAHASIYNRALSESEIKYLYEEMQKRIFRRIAPLEIRMR